MQVHTRRLRNEGDMGGACPSRSRYDLARGHVTCSTLSRVGSRWVKGGLSVSILAISYTGGRGGSSHYIHESKEVGLQSTEHVGYGHKEG